MTLDTIFDLASLTKVVATTTSVMMLVEDGQDPAERSRVATFVPGFERYGKGDITIRHLMTHTSGLRPDLDLARPWTRHRHGDRSSRSRKCRRRRPGERFVYSDINFFLLGDIVRRVSGMPLDEFAQRATSSSRSA